MSKLQIQTGDDRKDRRVVNVDGSVVTVGTETLDHVLSIQIEAEPGNAWVAVLRVYVNPNDLFVPQKVAEGKP